LTEFFEYLNSIYPPIQWTMEREANNKFHVFDIQLIRNGSHWETTVYRKPSASDRYLHFTSAQAWQEKAAAIHTLVARALHYCSTKLLLDAELLHITNVFIANGYPQKAIANIIAMKSHKHEALDSVEQLEELMKRNLRSTSRSPFMHHTTLEPGRCSSPCKKLLE